MPNLLRAPTRPYLSHLMDNKRWDAFSVRPDDIVVATFSKCGTTWTQRLVDMLIHQSTAPRPIMDTYPWLDATFFAPIEAVVGVLDAQTHRRSVKSHLPFDSLPIYEGVKYIHVARDGRDACFSMHNHSQGFTPLAIARISEQDTAPADGPPPTPDDPREFFLGWMADAEGDGVGSRGELSFFDFEMTYWRERHRPNVLMVHYNDLKADLAGEIRRISDFLEIETPDALVAEMARAGQFENMKSEGGELLPGIGQFFDHGHNRFLNKGTNGRWRDALNADDLARYAAAANRKLSPSAAAWVEKGRLAAGDPTSLPD